MATCCRQLDVQVFLIPRAAHGSAVDNAGQDASHHLIMMRMALEPSFFGRPGYLLRVTAALCHKMSIAMPQHNLPHAGSHLMLQPEEFYREAFRVVNPTIHVARGGVQQVSLKLLN